MLNVSCAIILFHDKILATQRSETMDLPLKWEFPGGKVEANESAEEALIREIKEELDLEITILRPLSPNIHAYSNKVIRLIPFICQIEDSNLVLKEHLNYRWLTKNELQSLDWAEADIPIMEELIKEDL